MGQNTASKTQPRFIHQRWAQFLKMKILLLIIGLGLTGQVFSQPTTSTIKFANDIALTGTVEPFTESKHKYDTCDSGLGWKTICLIDGQIWYGNDLGLKVPKNQLTRLTLKINRNDINLDVSGMFNPNFGGGPLKNKTQKTDQSQAQAVNAKQFLEALNKFFDPKKQPAHDGAAVKQHAIEVASRLIELQDGKPPKSQNSIQQCINDFLRVLEDVHQQK